MTDETCTTSDAARALNLARGTVASMVRHGVLVGEKTGREYVVSRVSLEAELHRRRGVVQRFGKLPMPAKGTIGTNLDRIMRAKGFTQQSLSDASGVAQSRISQMIRGRTTTRVQRLAVLARTLGVTVADLIREEGAANDPASNLEATARVLGVTVADLTGQDLSSSST